VIVKAVAGGAVVRLGDVARIEVGAETEDGFAEVNGRPAVLVAVTPWPGKLTADEARAAAGRVANLPPGVRVEVAADGAAGRLAVVALQLPDAASRERTRDLVARASRVAEAVTGQPGYTAFGGGGPEPNFGTLMVPLPADRPGTPARLREALNQQLRESVALVAEVTGRREPFPVRVAVCDTRDRDRDALRTAADAAAGRLRQEAALADVSPSSGRPVPAIRVRVDREKMAKLGVTADELTAALAAVGTRLGPDGRTAVYAAGADRPGRPENLRVRNAKGEMVQLGRFTQVEVVVSERVLTRVNMHPAVILTANPADGVTSADAAARALKAAAAGLPDGFRAVDLTRPAH
jgi:multidrug efflux pump subunit AcrB